MDKAIASEFKALPCGYSHLGTFNHECGKPSVLAGGRKSDWTVSGVFWSRRCLSCSKENGQDNWGIEYWVTYDPKVHINVWK